MKALMILEMDSMIQQRELSATTKENLKETSKRTKNNGSLKNVDIMPGSLKSRITT